MALPGRRAAGRWRCGWHGRCSGWRGRRRQGRGRGRKQRWQGCRGRLRQGCGHTCRQKERREPAGVQGAAFGPSSAAANRASDGRRRPSRAARRPRSAGPTTPSPEWRAAHGQCCPSGRPLGGELLAAKGGPLDVLESCSSPISAVGMGLSPKPATAGAGSPVTETNASTISLRISSRNMPPHMLSSRMDEISVSSEGSRAAGCGLRSSLHMRGGGVSCPKRTEGPTTRPNGPTKRRLAIRSG